MTVPGLAIAQLAYLRALHHYSQECREDRHTDCAGCYCPCLCGERDE